MPVSNNVAFASSLLTCLLRSSWGFNSLSLPHLQRHHYSVQDNHVVASARSNQQYLSLHMEKEGSDSSFSLTDNPTRRNFFTSMASSTLATTLITTSSIILPTLPAAANAEGAPSKSTADATITDKIFIEFKGLTPPNTDGIGNNKPDRITIALFGQDAPQPTSIIKQLVTRDGYKSKCKPLDTSRTLQKEQLEANKVYNSCMDNQDTVGVNYDYSTVWRVVKDERIDVGAVSGKFIARENPNFEDARSGLTHDAPGVVSVRRGDEAGYSFTIFPGTSGSSSAAAASMLDEDSVVIGRVIEGMDVVEKLNETPVVKSAGRKLTGGAKAKNAPSRGCRYGGSEYFCSEDKPLKKILLDRTGVL